MNRRNFLRTATMATTSLAFSAPAIVRGQNLNSRLQVACIGLGNQGLSDANATAKAGASIIAVCDPDTRMLRRALSHISTQPKTFQDYNQLFSSLNSEIDAVTISTPDHLHGIISKLALNQGKHVYCQKPLTHTIAEARELKSLTQQKKLATQMGNQGSALEGLRRGIEVIQSGIIGKPTELHVWSNRPVWPQGIPHPSQTTSPPQELDWQTWLGPAKKRPYADAAYHPFNWRGWYDYGTGALGDMACHTLNLPFRALKLSAPSSIICEVATRHNQDSYPTSSRIRYQFPSRGDLPPLTFVWYDGAPNPNNPPQRPFPDTVKNILDFRGKLPDSGCLIIGDQGELFSPDDYGGTCFIKHKSDEKFIHLQKHPLAEAIPQSLPRTPNHFVEWIQMIQTGTPTFSNFEIACDLTEPILLGCIAQRIGEGKLIEWDSPSMSSPNQKIVNQLVKSPTLIS